MMMMMMMLERNDIVSPRKIATVPSGTNRLWARELVTESERCYEVKIYSHQKTSSKQLDYLAS